MIGENRQLVKDEAAEFENSRLKFKTAGKLPIILEEFIRIFPSLIKESRTMPTCSRLDLPTVGSQPVMPKNLPSHWIH